MPHSQTISNLKDYLIAEAATRRGMEVRKEELKGANLKSGIPQQDNFCDCGLFLCGYVHKFMDNPHEFGRKLLAQEFDLESDWPYMNPAKMRASMRDMLQEFAKDQARTRQEEKMARKAERLAKKRGLVSSPPPKTSHVASPKSPEPEPAVLTSPHVTYQLVAALPGAKDQAVDTRSSSPPFESSAVPSSLNDPTSKEMLLDCLAKENSHHGAIQPYKQEKNDLQLQTENSVRPASSSPPPIINLEDSPLQRPTDDGHSESLQQQVSSDREHVPESSPSEIEKELQEYANGTSSNTLGDSDDLPDVLPDLEPKEVRHDEVL